MAFDRPTDGRQPNTFHGNYVALDDHSLANGYFSGR